MPFRGGEAPPDSGAGIQQPGFSTDNEAGISRGFGEKFHAHEARGQADMDYEQDHCEYEQNEDGEFDTGCDYESEFASAAESMPTEQPDAVPEQSAAELAEHERRESARQGNELLSFVTTIQKELDQLRAVSVEQDSIIELNEQLRAENLRRHAELEAKSTALNEQVQALEAQREEFSEQSARLAEQHSQLAEQNTELERRAGELAEAEGRIEKLRTELTAEADQFNQQKEAHAQASRLLADEREQLEETRKQLEARATELAEQSRVLTEGLAELDERQQALAARAEVLETEEAALREQVARVESRSAELETQHQANCKRTEELTLEWDRLDCARTENEQVTQALELEAQKNAARRDSIQVAGDQLARQKMELLDERAALEADERILNQERARLEVLQRGGAAGTTSAADATENTQTAESQAQAQKAITELEVELEKRAEAITTLANQFRKLKAELVAVESADKEKAAQLEALAGSVPAGGVSAGAKSQLALRRQRLQLQRRLIRERQTNRQESKYEQRVRTDASEELAAEREMLAEVRNDLAKAERQMIRKWAHATVITRLFLFVATVLLLAGACYFGTLQFVPAHYIANASISAQARPGFPMTAEQTQTWQSVNEELVFSAGVIDSAAQRLAQRGFKEFRDPAALRSFLDANLTVTSSAAGTIELSLVAQGAEDTRRILETFAISLVSSSNASRTKRTDGAKTKLLAAAAIDPAPIKDERLLYAGIAFGGSLLLILPLGGLLYSRLRKVGQVFDTTGEIFESNLDNEQRWQSIRDNTDGIITEHLIK